MTTIYNRFNRWSKQGAWEDVFYALSSNNGVVSTTSVGSSYVKAHCSAAGAKGWSMIKPSDDRAADGRIKIHAVTDGAGWSFAFTLTPGQKHDLVGAGAFLACIPTPKRLIADRTNAARKQRDWLAERDCEAVIPPNLTRKHPNAYDATAYRARNMIECMFCRLKDFRRIASRYDKYAANYLAGVFVAAIITWWTN